MKALRERQLISIVLTGEIRRGRIRCCDPDGTRPDGLYLAVGGRARGLTPQRIDLSQLTPETEGVTWARGWNTEAAKALETALALSDDTKVTPRVSWSSAVKTGLGALAAKNPAKASLGEAFHAFLGGFLADVAFQTAKQQSPAPPLPLKPKP